MSTGCMLSAMVTRCLIRFLVVENALHSTTKMQLQQRSDAARQPWRSATGVSVMFVLASACPPALPEGPSRAPIIVVEATWRGRKAPTTHPCSKAVHVPVGVSIFAGSLDNSQTLARGRGARVLCCCPLLPCWPRGACFDPCPSKRTPLHKSSGPSRDHCRLPHLELGAPARWLCSVPCRHSLCGQGAASAPAKSGPKPASALGKPAPTPPRTSGEPAPPPTLRPGLSYLIGLSLSPFLLPWTGSAARCGPLRQACVCHGVYLARPWPCLATLPSVPSYTAWHSPVCTLNRQVRFLRLRATHCSTSAFVPSGWDLSFLQARA